MDTQSLNIGFGCVVILFQLGITYSLKKRRSDEQRRDRDIGKLYTRTEDNAKEIAVIKERLKNHIDYSKE